MPYKSGSQRGKMHAMAERGEISKKVVKEFDRESKGQKDLPEHVKKKKGGEGRKGMPLIDMKKALGY